MKGLNAVKYSTPVVTVLKLLAHRERVSVVILLPFQIILTAPRRASCQGQLLKTVHFSSGRKVLYLFKIYCYNGIRSVLQNLLMRPNFIAMCNLWRNKKTVSNVLLDMRIHSMIVRVWQKSFGKVSLEVAKSHFGKNRFE